MIVIQNQVRLTNKSDLILNIKENLSLRHPMSGNIGSTACLAVTKRAKSHLNIRMVGSTDILMTFTLLSGACKYFETNSKHPQLLKQFNSILSCDTAKLQKERSSKTHLGWSYNCCVPSDNVSFSFFNT